MIVDTSANRKPQSGLKNFRCPDPLWEQGKAAAHEDDMSLGEVMRALLRKYVAGDVKV